MGVFESKNDKDVYMQSVKSFSDIEQAILVTCFRKITTGTAESFNKRDLENFLSKIFPQRVTHAIFAEMCRMPSSSSHNAVTSVTLEMFDHFISRLLKKSLSEKARIFLTIATDVRSQSAKCSQLLRFCELLVAAYLHCGLNGMSTDSERIKSWQLTLDRQALQQLSRMLITDLVIALPMHSTHDTSSVGANRNENSSSCFAMNEIEQWLFKTPLITRISDRLFTACFMYHATPDVEATDVAEGDTDSIDSCEIKAMMADILMPYCVLERNEKPSQLLKYSTILMVNEFLEPQLRDEWRLLFSSVQHGESFSTLCNKIINKGPTILIVRDKNGHVFGGVATKSWAYNPQFFGDSKCFLFTASPNMSIYTPTRYNENYQYVNNNMQTLPNGLGMGGQLTYFGLWIDAEYGKGHSMAAPKCTTYGSPQLSKKKNFDIDCLEVWALGRKAKNKLDKVSSKSVLDQDPAAQALLELIGKKTHSVGLREPEDD